MARFEAVLREGITSGREYVFAQTRRENGAANERDNMLVMTVANMVDHANGGRVVQGAHPSDPNAVVVALIGADGSVSYRTVTYRYIGPVKSTDEDLTDVLLASIIAVQAVTL